MKKLKFVLFSRICPILASHFQRFKLLTYFWDLQCFKNKILTSLWVFLGPNGTFTYRVLTSLWDLLGLLMTSLWDLMGHLPKYFLVNYCARDFTLLSVRNIFHLRARSICLFVCLLGNLIFNLRKPTKDIFQKTDDCCVNA